MLVSYLLNRGKDNCEKRVNQIRNGNILANRTLAKTIRTDALARVDLILSVAFVCFAKQ